MAEQKETADKQCEDQAAAAAEVAIRLHTKQDGVPIYATVSDTPIRFDDDGDAPRGRKREDVRDVSGAFVVRNVLSPRECQQFIDITERMGPCDAQRPTPLFASQPQQLLLLACDVVSSPNACANASHPLTAATHPARSNGTTARLTLPSRAHK